MEVERELSRGRGIRKVNPASTLSGPGCTLEREVDMVSPDEKMQEPGGPPPSEGKGERKKAYPRRILVRDRGTIYVVSVERIRWVGAEGAYVSLHTGEGTRLLRMCIGKFEEMLSPEKFARIHRSAIVNLDSVSRLLSVEGGKCAVVLDDDTRLVMSRTFRDGLLRRLDPLNSLC